MATIYFNPRTSYVTAGTTRFLTVTTGAAQQVIVGSGLHYMTVYNHGTGNLIWGGANIAVNSGNYVYVNQRVEFDNLRGDWSVYLRADSVSTIVSITESVR